MPRAIKGFDANLQCRGYQFEIGKTYTHEGKVKACESGFHAVPDDVHPLTVFKYYAPAGSRFCVVEYGGATDKSEGDKVAAETMTVQREIGLGDLAKGAVAWVMARAKPEGEMAKCENGLATASGDQGAATASGDQGAATAEHSTAGAWSHGWKGRVKGVIGSALHCDEIADDGEILSVACGIVGRDGIKPGTWYRCEGGKLVEA